VTAPPVNEPVWTLVRDSRFTRFLAAITLGGLGEQISLLALPLVAILVLQASPFELGLIGALQFLPVIVVTPVAGVMVDKFAPRLMNGLADVARGFVALSVPFMWWTGVLTLSSIYVVAVLGGCLRALSDVSHHSMLPSLVERRQLVRGNTAVNTSYSVTEVGGPGLGGVLVQGLGAPLALFGDGLGFIASGTLILSIRSFGKHQDRTGSSNWLSLIVGGFKYLLGERRLLWLGICGGVSNIFMFAFTTVLALFVVTDLGLEPFVLGLVLSVGAIGGIAGAFIASGVRRSLSLASTLLTSELVAGVGITLIATARLLADDAAHIAIVSMGMIIYSAAMAVYNVHSMSTRQALAPPNQLGRVTAGYRLISHGAIPLGALLGGTAAQLWGTPTLIGAAGLAVIIWALVLRRTPFMLLNRPISLDE
jgi:hypothetical protein